MSASAGPATEADFFARTEGEDAYAAIIDDTVAGLLTIWRPEPFIHYLVVDRAFRNRGIGSALLAFAVARLGRPVDLKCDIHNRPAQSLYEKHGWRIVERVMGPGPAFYRYRLEPGHTGDR